MSVNDRLIYIAWKSLTPDLRYLRPLRWNVIKEVILKYNLKSVLEFGSGVSTILFDNLNMDVISFETNLGHVAFVANLCSNATIIFWDNESLSMRGHFDLALIDGALPRDTQLDVAIKRADFIAVDDYTGRIKRDLSPKLANLNRIDEGTTILAMFDNRSFKL